MTKTETKLKDVYIVEPQCFGDHRGWFMESYSKTKFEALGINIDFVQDNHSYSAQKGVFRGIHFQKAPYAQTKLVRCTRGEIIDFIVDLRAGSPSYLSYIAVTLSVENKKMVLIPQGFGHGFLTVTDDVEVQYKTDNFYNKDCDRSINYLDPQIKIDFSAVTSADMILSDKDKQAPLLADSDVEFKY